MVYSKYHGLNNQINNKDIQNEAKALKSKSQTLHNFNPVQPRTHGFFLVLRVSSESEEDNVIEVEKFFKSIILI